MALSVARAVALLFLVSVPGVFSQCSGKDSSGNTYTCPAGEEYCCQNNVGTATSCDIFGQTTQGLTTPWKCKCLTQNMRYGPYQITLPINSTTYPDCSTLKGSTTTCSAGIMSRASCCTYCHNMNINTTTATGVKCNYWLHYAPGTSTGCSGCNTNVLLQTQCGYCLIYRAGQTPTYNPNARCPESKAPFFNMLMNYAAVGKGCTYAQNDPHFTGAQGTEFDFNGLPDQSFCLLTDPKFHINMKMTGYYDERTYGASILKDGKAVRTWIKELGILWLDPKTGATRTLQLRARDGKATERGDGYLGAIVVDQILKPLLKPGEVLTSEGGLTIKFVGYEKQGGGFFDVDAYEIEIAGLFSFDMKLRVAHPLLQTADDAMTHINVQFDFVQHTEKTHGVLGQTFQKGRERRAMDYTMLAALMGKKVAADGEIGVGFLDGSVTDYVAPNVLSPKCQYSAFIGDLVPAVL